MELSAIGLFVHESILSIPHDYERVSLGETVAMPNLIHLIFTLPQNETDHNYTQSPSQQLMPMHKGLRPLIPGSDSSIINHFKGKVTKWCKANQHDYFQWQLRFHHFIRNSKSYSNISNYIANNIYNWDNDENNRDGNNFRKGIRT